MKFLLKGFDISCISPSPRFSFFFFFFSVFAIFWFHFCKTLKPFKKSWKQTRVLSAPKFNYFSLWISLSTFNECVLTFPRRGFSFYVLQMVRHVGTTRNHLTHDQACENPGSIAELTSQTIQHCKAISDVKSIIDPGLSQAQY